MVRRKGAVPSCFSSWSSSLSLSSERFDSTDVSYNINNSVTIIFIHQNSWNYSEHSSSEIDKK